MLFEFELLESVEVDVELVGIFFFLKNVVLEKIKEMVCIVVWKVVEVLEKKLYYFMW